MKKMKNKNIINLFCFGGNNIFLFVESAVIIENQRFTTTTWKTKKQFTTLSTNLQQRKF